MNGIFDAFNTFQYSVYDIVLKKFLFSSWILLNWVVFYEDFQAIFIKIITKRISLYGISSHCVVPMLINIHQHTVQRTCRKYILTIKHFSFILLEKSMLTRNSSSWNMIFQVILNRTLHNLHIFEAIVQTIGDNPSFKMANYNYHLMFTKWLYKNAVYSQ